MAIIWCGGEDMDFPFGATPKTVTTGNYRSGYARGALYGGAYSRSNSFSTMTSGWFSFWARTFEGTTSSSNALLAGVTVDDSFDGWWIRKNLGRVRLFNRVSGAAETIVDETNVSLSATGLNKFDVEFVYAESGSIKVYLNTVLVIDYSGDTRIATASGLSSVSIYGHSTALNGALSELIVADEDTRLMSLKTLAPNADGDINEWAGSYSNIASFNANDATVIYTTDAEKDFQCQLTGMPNNALENFSVKAVKISARATDAVGGLGMQIGIKTNNQTVLGATKELDTVFGTHEELYNRNQATGKAFTAEEIEALQLAIRSKAV